MLGACDAACTDPLRGPASGLLCREVASFHGHGAKPLRQRTSFLPIARRRRTRRSMARRSHAPTVRLYPALQRDLNRWGRRFRTRLRHRVRPGVSNEYSCGCREVPPVVRRIRHVSGNDQSATESQAHHAGASLRLTGSCRLPSMRQMECPTVTHCLPGKIALYSA